MRDKTHLFTKSKCIILFTVLCLTMFSSIVRASEILIEGKACKGIYLLKSTPAYQPYDEKAAKVLQEYLLKASGTRPSINYLTPEQKAKPGMIVVGQAAEKSGIIKKKTINSLNPGGYVISVKDGIAAIGSPGRDGVISGAYALIEKVLGVAFLASAADYAITEPEIKPDTTVVFKEMRISRSPAFAFRFIRDGEPIGYSSYMLMGDATLVGCSYSRTCHTAAGFINYDKYKDSHPEYFAMLTNGKRMRKAPNQRRFDLHYCTSNPDVQKIVTESTVKWMKSDPKAEYFWVSPGDGNNRYCHCPKCLAQDIKKGVVSDRWLKFINKIAAVVAKKCPGKKILTLAYVDLEAPPIKTRPLDNVVVMYCPYPNNWSNHLAAFDDPEYNGAGIKTLKGWTKIARKNMGIFCYPSSCSEELGIWPSFYANYAKIKYYAANKFEGIEFCGLYPYGRGLPGHNSFNELQRYVLSKVLWNPALDVEQEIDHFMKLYYGAGAKDMRDFFNLIHKQVDVKGRHYVQHTEQTKRGFVTDEFAKQAYAIFAKAEKATRGTGRYHDRVLKEKLYMLFADLSDRCLTNAKIAPKDMPVYAKKIGEFLRLCKKFNIAYFSRRGAVNWFWDTMMVKVSDARIYNDPNIMKLMTKPLRFLESNIPRNQKKIAGGWDIPAAGIMGGEAISSYASAGVTKKGLKVFRRPTSGIGDVMAFLYLDSAPKSGTLIIEAMNRGNENKGGKGLQDPARMEIEINGKKIYSGKASFKDKWVPVKFSIPEGVLQKGKNQIILRNTTPDKLSEDTRGIDYIAQLKQTYYWGWIIISDLKVLLK